MCTLLKFMESPLQVPDSVEGDEMVRVHEITPSDEVNEIVGKPEESPEIDLEMYLPVNMFA